MHHNIYASILVMFLTIYAVRALPLTLIRREIRNPFIQSFLYYVPYVSLSVMTFPSINRKPDHGNCRICGRGDPCLDRWKSVPCFYWCLCSSLYCGDVFALKSEQTCAEACKPLENIDK